MSSQRLNQLAQGIHGSSPDPPSITAINIFCGTPNHENIWVCDSFAYSWDLFYCWFAMSNVDMIIFRFFLLQYILFHHFWLLSFGILFFYDKRQKGVDSERRGGMEGGETVKSGCYV